MKRVNNGVEVDVDKIKVSPYFFRETPAQEDLETLAESIKALGQIHPVSVIRLPKKSPKGIEFELINGHRRFLAIKRAGLSTIRADLYEYTQEELASEEEKTLAVTQFLHAANYQEALTPLERAKNYKQLMETMDLGIEDIARLMSRSEADIREDLKYAWIAPGVQDMLIKPDNAKKVTREHLRVLADWASPDKKGWRLEAEGQKLLVQKLLAQEDKEVVEYPAKFDKAIKSYVQEERRKKIEERKKQEQEQERKEETKVRPPDKVAFELLCDLDSVDRAVQKLVRTELPPELQLKFVDKSEIITKIHTLARDMVRYAERIGKVGETPEPAIAIAESGQQTN